MAEWLNFFVLILFICISVEGMKNKMIRTNIRLNYERMNEWRTNNKNNKMKIFRTNERLLLISTSLHVSLYFYLPLLSTLYSFLPSHFFFNFIVYLHRFSFHTYSSSVLVSYICIIFWCLARMKFISMGKQSYYSI